MLVRFLLGEPPYEPGDVVELDEAEAENKLLDGIVEYLDAFPVEEYDNEDYGVDVGSEPEAEAEEADGE